MTTSGVYLELPLHRIDPGTNVRTKVDTALKASIEDVGVLQPITVAPAGEDRYVCLYGHRRLAAARAAGRTTIPAVVQRLPEDLPLDLPLRQLIENGQRRPVNPLDIARTIRAYLDEHPGARQADVARRLGRSGFWISQKLLLLDMDPELQRRVAAGELRDDLAVKVHRATTTQTRRSRPRTLRAGESPGVARAVVELESPTGGSSGQATIELDRNRGRLELLLEDGAGDGIAVAMTPDAGRLLGKRLIQAFEATQARPAA